MSSHNPFADTANTTGEKITLESDRLGGSFVWDTDAYLVTINNAYAGVSASGARSMTFEVTGPDGRKHKFVEWVASGTDKGGKNYSEKDGVKSYLPGYNRSNAIAMLTTEKELHAQRWEEKMVKIRNAATQTEVPTPTQVAVEMLGKQVYFGILKVESNKSIKVQENGKNVYKRTAELRTENELDKIFYAKDQRTIAELRDKKPAAEFYPQWLEANKGKTVNKVKPAEVASPAGGATAGAPGQAAADAAPTDSLFN